MSGKQSAVMWMGLLLVAANLFTSKMWQEIWNGTILMGNSNSQQAKKNLTLPNPLGNPGGGGQWWFPYMNSTGGTTTQKPAPSASQLST